MKNDTDVNKKYRDSARGETCTLQIYGVCNHDPETTVLAHLKGNGMGLKCPDFLGVYACSDCHDAIDGRTRHDISLEDFWMYKCTALMRTLERAFARGLIQWQPKN